MIVIVLLYQGRVVGVRSRGVRVADIVREEFR